MNTTIIKKPTPELYRQAKEILGKVNQKKPKYQQAWDITDAYALFGIIATWNSRMKRWYLHIGFKDAYNTGPGSMCNGISVELPTFQQIFNVESVVEDFRKGFATVHANRPQQLALMEM